MNAHRTLNPLVLIPAYNEDASIELVIRKVKSLGFEVLVIDDGSTDDTYQMALGAGARCISLPVNLGVGGALRTGFAAAIASGFDSVIQCDADGQHDPSQFHLLISAALDNDHDMVIGSRFASRATAYEVSFSRRFAIGMLSWLASRHLPNKITDASSGFRVIREPLLTQFAKEFPYHYLGDTFEVLEAAARAGYSIGEVSVMMHQRESGVSSSGIVDSVVLIIRVLTILILRNGTHFAPKSAK